MSALVRGIGVVVGILVVGVGVYVLREETMTRHSIQDPASRMEVVIHAAVRGPEPGRTVFEYARAKVLVCRTEVALADPTPLQPVDGDGEDLTLRFVLRPALDDADEKQFRGCLEDWSLDHVDIDVLEMRDLPAGSPTGSDL